MSSNNSRDPDHDHRRDGTVTRKMKTLQEMGVLDDTEDESGVSSGTAAVKTYPFTKTKRSGVGRLVSWLKKD